MDLKKHLFVARALAVTFCVITIALYVLNGATVRQYEENAALKDQLYEAKLEEQALEYEHKLLELEKRVEALESSGMIDGKASEEDKAKFKEDLQTLGEEMRAARDWALEKAQVAEDVLDDELREQTEKHPEIEDIPIIGDLIVTLRDN